MNPVLAEPVRHTISHIHKTGALALTNGHAMLTTTELDANQAGAIDQAADILRQGGLVAIPTETVYGLAADAGNSVAIRKVFEAKQRPIGHPLIVHLADPADVRYWAAPVPEMAWRLMEHYWPGPLTLLLPKKEGVSDLITGGQPGVAVRMPAHPVALATLKALGRDLVAPSANPYGRISPTSASHVVRGLAGRIDAILDGGSCSVGIESTILDLTGEQPAIARPGQIGQAELEAFLGMQVLSHAPTQRAVPGNVKRHYQPATPTLGVPADHFAETVTQLAATSERLGALWWHSPPPESAVAESIRLSDEPAGYGRMLYTALHALDQAGLTRIVVELPPASEPWRAINDRLSRACSQ